MSGENRGAGVKVGFESRRVAVGVRLGLSGESSALESHSHHLELSDER